MKLQENNFVHNTRRIGGIRNRSRKGLEAAENYIDNANSLLDIANYPPFHFERLKGNRKNEWSIRLGNTGYRVTMIPCDDDENEIIEGDIMAQCKVIKIVKVTEVSNHYE